MISSFLSLSPFFFIIRLHLDFYQKHSQVDVGEVSSISKP